jgi:hypothetical protein
MGGSGGSILEEKQFTERAPRLSLDVEVNCGGKAIAHSRNISKTGIALITDFQLNENDFIQIKLSLPGVEAQINAFGKVMRSSSVSENFFESGIKFWSIEDSDMEILTQFFDNQ